MRFCLARRTCLSGLVALAVLHVSAFARQHRVEEGESLWTLAAKHKTTVGALCRANSLDEKAVLQLGQQLVIPDASAVPVTSTIYQVHQVREGDTLSEIAAKCGLSVAALQRVNSLQDTDTLQVGQRIRIPVKVTTRPSGRPPVGYLTGASVNVRVGPGAGYGRVAVAGKGTRVSLLGECEGWLKVRFENRREAWVSADQIKTAGADDVPAVAKPRLPAAKPAKAQPTGFLAAAEAAVHSGPGAGYKRTATGRKGTRVELMGKCKGWFQVRFSNGTQGWVPRQSLKPDDGDRVRQVAAPLLPGGESPDRGRAPATKPKEEDEAPQPPTGTLLAGATLHTGPSVRYPESGTVTAGAKCALLGKALGWFKVQVDDSEAGWVAWDKLETQTAEQVKTAAYPELPSGTEAIGGEQKRAPSSGRIELTPTPGEAPVPEAALGTAVAHASSAAPSADLAQQSREAVARALAAAGGEPPARKAYIATDGVNLRDGPSTDHGRLTQLRRGTPVEIIESQDSWHHVKVSEKREGWVAAWLVSPTPPSAPQRLARAEDLLPDAAASAPIASAAMRYRGVPYRRGGTTSRGLDCSGLVSRILQNQGISAPRTSAELYRAGTPVTKENLHSGDLVFFRDTYRRGVSHVGIYLGDGEFVHASTHGRGVVVTELSSPYYARRWAGARRVR